MIIMSDPLIRELDDYVVFEPGAEEKFLSTNETLKWLQKWLESLEVLPDDLQGEASLESASQRLLDTACALEVKPGITLQWFAVRLNPPDS